MPENPENSRRQKNIEIIGTLSFFLSDNVNSLDDGKKSRNHIYDSSPSLTSIHMCIVSNAKRMQI